ncbi:MAG TPA: hypothetical protein VHG10_05255 [Glycomyces sp.]|nr:hypothetical protein [Glycomyces sp.]
MTDTPRNTEVADYEAAVRRHLADLPSADREDLLADLETHLTEVAADLEPGVSLVDRLGTPEAYANELREAAGVEDAGVEEPQGGSSARHTFAAGLARAERYADRVTGSAGAGTFQEFRKSLVPAWWVLRGAAAACLLVYVMLQLAGGPVSYPILTPEFIVVLTILAAAVGAWYSVRLGVRSAGWKRGPRWALTLGGVLVVWIAAAQFADVFFGTTYVEYAESGYDPYSYVEDVYPYSADGELLTGVYLFDQHGTPLYIGDPDRCSVLTEDPFGQTVPEEFDDSTTEDANGEFESEEPFGNSGTGESFDSGGEYGYQYPMCVPGGGAGATPSESSTETPEPDASESPTDEPAATSASPTTDSSPTDEPAATSEAPTTDPSPTDE